MKELWRNVYIGTIDAVLRCICRLMQCICDYPYGEERTSVNNTRKEKQHIIDCYTVKASTLDSLYGVERRIA